MAEKKGKLAEIKTKPTASSIADYISTLPDEQQRKDSLTLIEMMQKASGQEPVLWGNSMIGFGNKRYKSPASGREVDWFLIGFAPRKANLSLHLTMALNQHDAALEKLGKHKTGGGCLYINKLADVDLKVLRKIIDNALKQKA